MIKNIFKSILIIIGFLFLLYTLFVFAVESITGDKRGFGLSYTINEAQENNSLVATYRIKHAPDSTINHLQKFDYWNELSDSAIWVEKPTGYKSKFLYFNEKIYLNENNLVLKNPRQLKEKKDSTFMMSVIQGDNPDFGTRLNKTFKLTDIGDGRNGNKRIKIRFGETQEDRNSPKGNQHNYSQFISSSHLGEELPNEIVIWTYLTFEPLDTNDIDCGPITLELNYVNQDTTFKETRKWYEKITYLP